MAAVMNAPLYTIEILRLAGSLPDPMHLERVDGAAQLRSPTCGSTVRTEVQLDAEGTVAAVSQQVRACAFGQASAALVARDAHGKSREDIAEALAPARSRTSRHGAILLPFRALLAALESAR